MERLLIEKPDNPIAFIVEYLQKTYPDQAQVSSAALHPDKYVMSPRNRLFRKS